MRTNLAVLLDAVRLLIAKATFIGLRLLTLYLCAAYLDRASFGALALAFTTAEICRYIGDWGTDVWSLRRFAQLEAVPARLQLWQVVRLRVVGSLIGGALAWIGIELLAPQPSLWQCTAISLTAVTSLWLNLGVNWFQARASLGRIAVLFAVAGSLCALLLGLEHHAHARVMTRLITLLTFEILLVACVLVLALRTGCEGSAAWTRPALRNWFAEATPIAFAMLLALAYGRLDQFYVSRTASPAILGDYSLAQRLVEPILFIAAAMSSTIYSRASVFIHERGRSSETAGYAWRWVRTVSSAAAIVSLGIGAAFALLRHYVLPGYSGAVTFLWIALLCTFFRCTNLSLTAFIQAFGAYRSMFKIGLFNAVSITVAVIGGGTLFGPLGAALGVSFGEALNTGVQTYKLRKLLSTGS